MHDSVPMKGYLLFSHDNSNESKANIQREQKFLSSKYSSQKSLFSLQKIVIQSGDAFVTPVVLSTSNLESKRPILMF